MSLRPHSRAVVVAVSVGVVVGVSGCGAEAKPACETAVRGTATDEVVLVFADLREFSDDDPAAPTLSVPAEGQVFDKDDAPPTFSWGDELAVVTPRVHRAAPSTLAPAPSAPTPGWFESIAHLVIGTASAHLPPVTGAMYLLQWPAALDEQTCPARTITSDLTLPIDAAQWAQMKDVGALTLTMTSAYLVEGRVTEGPYRTTRHFSVE